MNLEAIEQRVLSYLKQATNPLVPFDQLLEFLRREEELGAFSDAELLAFLRNHELFDVVEPIQIDVGELSEDELNEAGLRLTPHIILTTRVPTEREMAEQMAKQLQSLVDSLNAAMVAAKEAGDSSKAQALIVLLARAQELEKHVTKFA